jgi:hypothetical protein
MGLSSRKYDPDPDFLSIPDPGSRGKKGTGSRIRIRNTVRINNALFDISDYGFMSGGGTELSSSGSDGDNKAEPWRVKVSYLSGIRGPFLRNN